MLVDVCVLHFSTVRICCGYAGTAWVCDAWYGVLLVYAVKAIERAYNAYKWKKTFNSMFQVRQGVTKFQAIWRYQTVHHTNQSASLIFVVRQSFCDQVSQCYSLMFSLLQTYHTVPLLISVCDCRGKQARYVVNLMRCDAAATIIQRNFRGKKVCLNVICSIITPSQVKLAYHTHVRQCDMLTRKQCGTPTDLLRAEGVEGSGQLCESRSAND